MNSRPRYQYGCLTRMKRTRGEDIWQFRFYETTKEGLRRRRARTIGTIAQYATRADALRAVEPFRHRLNLKHRFARPTSIRALVDLYVEQELSRLRYSTQRSYLSALKQWIEPQWGDCLLEELKPVPVEQWLRSLQLAPKSKVHISKSASPSVSMRTAMGTDRHQSNRLGAPGRRAQGHTSCADGGADSPVAGAIIPAIPHHGFDCGLPRPSGERDHGLAVG